MGYDFHHVARVARGAAALIGPDGGNWRAGGQRQGEDVWPGVKAGR